MALNASDVNAGDDILAAHNNALIDDIEQHTHDGTDTSYIGPQVITPASAVVGLMIDQNNNAQAFVIDSENTAGAVASINGRYPLNLTQDLSNGYGLKVIRNINEAGANALVKFEEDHASGTQAVLEIDNDGSGEEIKFTHAVTRYISIPGNDFHANNGDGQVHFQGTSGSLQDTDVNFAPKNWITKVNLPHGVIVTSLKMFYRQRDDAADLYLELRRNDFAGTQIIMARCDDQNIADSYGSHEDTTIASATINNTTYCYWLFAQLDNNDATSDMFLEGVVISYTIAEPLP